MPRASKTNQRKLNAYEQGKIINTYELSHGTNKISQNLNVPK